MEAESFSCRVEGVGVRILCRSPRGTEIAPIGSDCGAEVLVVSSREELDLDERLRSAISLVCSPSKVELVWLEGDHPTMCISRAAMVEIGGFDPAERDIGAAMREVHRRACEQRRFAAVEVTGIAKKATPVRTPETPRSGGPSRTTGAPEAYDFRVREVEFECRRSLEQTLSRVESCKGTADELLELATLGIDKLRQNQHDEALILLTAVTQRNPDMGDTQLAKALAEAHLGMIHDSIESVGRLLRANPAHPVGRELLDRLLAQDPPT